MTVLARKERVITNYIHSTFRRRNCGSCFREILYWRDRGFEDPDKNAGACWNRLPIELKRSYIQRRIDWHPDQPCILSSNVHGMLQLAADKIANDDQRAILTEKIIYGFLSGRFDPYIMFPTTLRKRVQDKPHLSPENAVCFNGTNHMPQLALAISAIKRSDCAELQKHFLTRVFNQICGPRS
jgi:hypothetical protein